MPKTGGQYASHTFRAELEADRITQGMSDKGNCYDNAVVESFFATLKTEAVDGANYETRQQAKTSVFSYPEGFCNAKPGHSSLGSCLPTTSRGYPSLKLLDCDSVKTGEDQRLYPLSG